MVTGMVSVIVMVMVEPRAKVNVMANDRVVAMVHRVPRLSGALPLGPPMMHRDSKQWIWGSPSRKGYDAWVVTVGASPSVHTRDETHAFLLNISY